MTAVKVAVINCSSPHYNLGAHKLFDWLSNRGDQVSYFDGDPGLFTPDSDLVCLSVIFSWHATIAREIALRMKDKADVWCGGPGMFALASWWKKETGLDCVNGLDQRFERQRGEYRMTFASRGCPVNCYFCIVPRIEGTAFTLDWEFQPRPILCDNNLSALPDDFQDHILARYKATDTPLADANSGFEPRTFTADTYNRWRGALKGPWRFALDEQRERQFVEPMMDILKGERAKRKQVYVLIGNEPMADCYDRAMTVIGWGGEPYCQPLLPLNALDRHAFKIAHDWTPRRLTDFARYFNRHLWRAIPIQEYKSRETEPATFAAMFK